VAYPSPDKDGNCHWPAEPPHYMLYYYEKIRKLDKTNEK
jgi:hypothetical protein